MDAWGNAESLVWGNVGNPAWGNAGNPVQGNTGNPARVNVQHGETSTADFSSRASTWLRLMISCMSAFCCRCPVAAAPAAGGASGLAAGGTSGTDCRWGSPPHELGEVDAAAATSRLLLLLLLLAVLVGECEVGGSAGPGQVPLLSRLGCATMRTALAACA